GARGERRGRAIGAGHGAIQSRAEEKAIVDASRTKSATARKAELVLIHKAWPAWRQATMYSSNACSTRMQQEPSIRGKDVHICGSSSRRSFMSTSTRSSTLNT